MSRQGRRAKAEQRLATLEAEFRTKLLASLETCSAGRWGLFGRYEGTPWSPSSDAEQLLELGEQIRVLRSALGFTTEFPLYERFKFYRNQRGCNAPGEPKLARSFLRELSDAN